MAWHAVAHGADAVLYWQWRSAPGGQEQLHGTLVDQSGQPCPFYEEAKQLAGDFAKSSNILTGTVPVADVVLLNSYDNRWSIHAQRHHRDFDYVAHFNHYYRALAARNIATDVLSADMSLDGYKLVIAPALLMLNEFRVARLKAFVENGGHLVLTIRSGMKDDFNVTLQREGGWVDTHTSTQRWARSLPPSLQHARGANPPQGTAHNARDD